MVGRGTDRGRWQPLDASPDSRRGRQPCARIRAKEPAESLIARHWFRSHDRIGARNRSPQIEPSMGPSLVVVLEPLNQDAL